MTWLRGVPIPEFRRKFLIDGIFMWIGIRIALPLMVLLFGSPGGGRIPVPGLSLGLPTSMTVVTLCGALVVVDALRRRESVLLANLGIPLRAVFVIGAIPAAVGEAVTSLIGGALGL